tara:strand:- start:24 stop:284 length:261 start_codon:yes stop_codon:yes gene_type:complete
MKEKQLYKPFKYTGNGKFKKSVYVKNGKGGKKLIHYGHSDYRHNYSPEARKSYLARAKGITNKAGQKTWKLKDTKNYWAVKDLWKG